jgi:hypothetical protein
MSVTIDALGYNFHAIAGEHRMPPLPDAIIPV